MNAELYSQKSKNKWKFDNTPEWSDEFDYSGLPDSAKWSFETGGDGWGNNELQYYTKGKNASVENGVLKITAKKEKKFSRKYTSSRLITRLKGQWLYGRIEVKAKMPKGRGTWPAVWMLPTDGFNAGHSVNGEIDILEYVGFEPDKIHFSVHTDENNNYSNNEITSEKKIKNAESKFHIYRMDWTPYGIRGYIDGKKYFEYMNNGKGKKYWPFDKKFFLIINLAIGGNWGGLVGVDDKIFPATFEIDYVRVYKFKQ